MCKNHIFDDFSEFPEITNSDSKSPFRYSPEVEIQQKAPNWKAETLSFPTVEESAPEDITIKSYDPFEIRQKINKIHEKSQKS